MTQDPIQKLIDDNSWQPIESGPRDDVLFLAKEGDNGFPFVCTYVSKEDGLVDHDWFAQMDAYGQPEYECSPTHWRPIPDNRAAEVIKVLWNSVEQVRNMLSYYQADYCEAELDDEVYKHLEQARNDLGEAIHHATKIAEG